MAKDQYLGKTIVPKKQMAKAKGLPWSTDLLRGSLEKVGVIQSKLLASQSQQKIYADRKVQDLEFVIGDQILLKISPMKGVMRFEKRSKLSPRYIRPFEILDRGVDVACELYTFELGRCSSGFFMYLSLKKYHADGTYIIRWDLVLLDENLTYEEEPIAILDRRGSKS
ncbi:uncharacterized protein LOC132065562 [Lycium ferocissimum]|uniref:uncharacterized protein LOC132065562 n=1 Tax=Lycium ferocissimum TaxID=112874 RepID=UPI0028153FAF|nr:uncharacterized protein LOC132065562 [Lycium ferocissimum]